ncbi:MAG: hypothetical protein V3V78_00070 [Candidatus Woesearchaeota archaeon]
MKKIIILFIALLMLSGCGVKDNSDWECDSAATCMYKMVKLQKTSHEMYENDCQNFSIKLLFKNLNTVNGKPTSNVDELTSNMVRNENICNYNFTIYSFIKGSSIKTYQITECKFPFDLDFETFGQVYKKGKSDTEYCTYKEIDAYGKVVTDFNYFNFTS